MCGAGRITTVVKMSNKTPNGGCECVKLRGIERLRVFSLTKLPMCYDTEYVLLKAHLARTSFTLNTSRHGSGGSLGTTCDADRSFARSARYDRGARPVSAVPK